MKDVSAGRFVAENGPSLAPRIAEQAILDDVVTELCEIDRRTGIERTLTIGELILTRFFWGAIRALGVIAAATRITP